LTGFNAERYEVIGVVRIVTILLLVEPVRHDLMRLPPRIRNCTPHHSGRGSISVGARQYTAP
jgi:hypothetical protein